MISVVICTYNRCASLQETLDCLTRMRPPEQGGWELVLVNNNSKDDTAGVAERFAARADLPVRLVLESQQGLSHARNAGVKAASGEVLLFTDDDTLIDPDWVRAMERAFRTSGCAAAGGRIVAKWTCEKPAWLATEGPYKIDGAVLSFDLGPELKPLARSPIGANMAIRKDVLERHGPFRTDLGYRGNELMMGEDAEYFHRMAAAGEKLVYVPDAIVHHRVEPERLTFKFLQAWYFGFGRYEALSNHPPQCVTWFGVPRHLWRTGISHSLRWLFGFGVQARAYYRFKMILAFGSITEYRKLAKSRDGGREESTCR